MLRLPAEPFERIRGALSGVRCCVTGGAGFIGSHLVDALVTAGATVSVIDDLSESSLAHLGQAIEMEPDRVRFVQASVLDPEALDEAVDGCSLVFHLAALNSVPRSVEFPARTWAVNATGTQRVLEAARQAGARRLVFSASSSAYGDTPTLPKHEQMMPHPLSPYAASKVSAEALCTAYAESFGLSTVSLRYFNVFGPRQRADSAYAGVIPAFMKRIDEGKPPRIFGDGEQSRDFTHVANAVYANLLAAVSQTPLAGEALNIGAGGRITVNELAQRVLAACDASHMSAEHAPARTGDVLHSQADVSAAREAIGYEPVMSLDEGLEGTVAWFRESRAGRAS